MARTYNHVIRFLESWFADLEDPSKEFTPEERWQVVQAIVKCQVDCSLEPLHSLPLVIRRALSVATMGEQLMAILDRADSYRRRARDGKAAAPAAPTIPQSKPSDIAKREEREKAAADREAKAHADEQQQISLRQIYGAANSRDLYIKMKEAADSGDILALAALNGDDVTNLLRERLTRLGANSRRKAK